MQDGKNDLFTGTEYAVIEIIVVELIQWAVDPDH